jgi:hypothetical protein
MISNLQLPVANNNEAHLTVGSTTSVPFRSGALFLLQVRANTEPSKELPPSEFLNKQTKIGYNWLQI